MASETKKLVIAGKNGGLNLSIGNKVGKSLYGIWGCLLRPF